MNPFLIMYSKKDIEIGISIINKALLNWAAEVLLLNAMSSEESSHEDDGNGQPKFAGY